MSSFVTPSAGSKHHGLNKQLKRCDDDSSSEDEWHFPSSEEEHQSNTTNNNLSSSASSNKRSKNKDASSFFWNALRQRNLDFAINGECTSVCFSKSGHFLWAGFSDGTIRVFDLTGLFGGTTMTCDTERTNHQEGKKKKQSSRMVSSKSHQSFGAVAAQIHARGVHTDLLTQVDIGDDYVFGGVQRGAMELYAIDTSALEAEVAAALAERGHRKPTRNILDFLTVHVHSDAKLKGFGAAVALQTEKQQPKSYLLLTGKGIKSIHIWKFHEPTPLNAMEATWSQLYDCQTNGNTINLLSFYRNALGQLWGVSQSDSQRLRLWDLSIEEKTPGSVTSSPPSSLALLNASPSSSSSSSTAEQRPRRPEYQDVQNSQAALAIGAGGFCVCGGPSMYNQLSIVSLDQPSSPYNHTELALPGTADQQDSNTASTLVGAGGRSSSRGGRQRRGDLKQVVRVSSLCQGVFHALLELDDGSIVHYKGSDPLEGGQSSHLDIVVPETTGIPPLPGDHWRRTMCLGFNRIVLSAVSMYNPHTQKGSLVVRALQDVPPPASPVAADPDALEMCMQVPSRSATVSRSKKKKNSGKKAGKRLIMAAPSSIQAPGNSAGRTKKDGTMSTSKSILSTTRTSPVTMKRGSTATVVPPSSTKKVATSKRSSSTSKSTPRLQRRGMATHLPPKISPCESLPTVDRAHEESAHSKPKKTLRLYLDMQPKRVFNDTAETPVKKRRVESSLPGKPHARQSTSALSNGRDATGSLVGPDKSPRRKRFEENRKEYPVRQLRSNATEGSLEDVASILVELKSPDAQKRENKKGHRLIPISPASQRRIATVKDKCVEFYEQLRRVFASLSTDMKIDWNPVAKKHTDEDSMALLTARHNAEHDAFKRRVIVPTMTVLHGIQNSKMTIEEARTQLQESSKSLMDILHDVVSRQELEMQVEASKQALPADRQRYDESLRSVKGIFDTIDGICKTLEPPKRLPGRPRGPVFELR